jgi:cytokinin dehydrogenase
VLGGLGQCGLVTRTNIDLVPCEPNVRGYQLFYTDNAQYFSDLRTLLERGEVPYMFTLFFPTPNGWLYILNIGAFYHPDAPPDDAFLLRDLSLPPLAAVVTEYDFLSYAFLVDTQVEIFRALMPWDDLIKPWVVTLLPDSVAEEYVGETIAGLTPVDLGPGGFIILFSMRRSTMTRPLPRVPDAELGNWVHNFGILTTSASPGPDPAVVEHMLARNLELYGRAQNLGATRYPIGAVPFKPADWEEHFGDFWEAFAHRKGQYDPDGILTPGPGIFS